MKGNHLRLAPYLSPLLLTWACGASGGKEAGGGGEPLIRTFTLENDSGGRVKITNFGASVMSILVPDRRGRLGEVELGYDRAGQYPAGNPYFGAIVGRYANRIARGRFELEGKPYQLARNNGPNHLHGGPRGFHDRVWDARPDAGGRRLELALSSPHGEEGYPGDLRVKVVYSWSDDYELRIDYEAQCEGTTVVNLTHHSFFNLEDGGAGNILDHRLRIAAEAFTPVDEDLIPTGEIRPVAGTPFDFRESKPIGRDIGEENRQLARGGGYDHNFILKRSGPGLVLAATVQAPRSGRRMEVYTTEPGLQFYSGNFLDGSDRGHEGQAYGHRSAFCLEAQHYPDSPNRPTFPSTVLRPGQTYTQTTVYRFSVRK